MVVELTNFSMTDNSSQSSHATPEFHRSKLRSSFKMIRKLFKAKKHDSASTGNLSSSDFGDDQSIDHASSTGSPPPPYRCDSLDKSVASIGSASSGGETHERRETLKLDCPEDPTQPSRIINVTIKRDSDALLGIVISVSNDKQGSYPVIRRVLPDSQASKSGSVFAGDEILKVNHIDVLGMTHRQVTSLFKTNGRQLTLSVKRKLADLFHSSASNGQAVVNGNRSCEASPSEDDKKFSYEDKSQVIEICRDDNTENNGDSSFKMSTFHPTSPTARAAPQLSSFSKGFKVPLPGMQNESHSKNESHGKNENEVVERFNRRAYSASAAVRSMKSPRHTLLVPGSADISLLTMQDLMTPQSAPASPAESRRAGSAESDDEPENDRKTFEFQEPGDVTEAWSAAPFVRSHSMRQPKRGDGKSWRERSASQSDGRKASHRRLRDSFRIGKKAKQSENLATDSSGSASQSQKSDSSSSKVMTVTLHVPSLQELGLRLTGGSVSPYGTCNLSAQSVSMYGTAKEVIKPGDSIITIDGINTEQMTAFEAYRLLQNYLGKSVEVVISRTLRK